MKRKTILIVAVVALVAVGAFFLVRSIGSSGSAEQTETVTVTRGALTQVVNATGNVAPAKRSTLSFELSGRVAEVLVHEGDTVQKGQPLVRLDAADLELALRSAEASLRAAQARYDQAKAGPSAEDIAAAEASLASAIASYEKLKKGPTADEVAIAKANVERAEAVLKQAQAAYDRIAWRGDAAASPQALQLQQAMIDYQTALANYRLATAGPTESALKAAEAQIAQARANLARLKRTPTPEDLTIAQSQVDSAQVAVEQARRRLDAATLRAPFDGVVEKISVEAGQLVAAGTPAVIIADTSAFHIMVAVDEMDVALVREGQTARISLDAIPDTPIQGHVERIGLAGSQVTGVVTYDVRIAVDPTNAPLRTGMSATIDIVVAEKPDALVLPNRAIRTDEKTGQRYVQVLRNGQVERVYIKPGIRDERYTEILEGPAEGETVVITTVSSGQQLRSLFGPQ
ncbi:MAG: efflux RND transporter periplasmic adaptor subunit [Anaerolineae bacterium]|jgi:HlyD family secretion protein|nr:efflux RND transporter periplasmic adaptor subunit [Anaerolineae bacterium]